MSMNDAQIRGQLLTKFYQLRRNVEGWVPVNDMLLTNANHDDHLAISGVCQQLADAGLIKFKPFSGGQAFLGTAQITGFGVDVVDGHKSSPIAVQFQNSPVPDTASTSTTIQIIPTLYPDHPDGNIIVPNHIEIDTTNEDFSAFLKSMTDLTAQLERSNEIAGETREKLLAELSAGLTILKSPKPDPNIVDLFLKRPLGFVIEKFASAAVDNVAISALALLGKITGFW